LAAGAQTTFTSPEHSGESSEALLFLNQIFEFYAHTDSYHIESVEETRLDGEFSRLWTRSLTTSIVGPGNRYRFETHSDHGNGLQISDGKTEWIYYPPFQQYIQHAVPSTGPSRIQSPTAPGLYSLTRAQNILKSFSNVQKLVRTAVHAPDESIEVNGKIIICNVIRAEGELPGISAHITTRFTFWIDKQTKVIRKMIEHREGPLHPTEPSTKYVMERDTLFPVADLKLTFFPDRIFTFEPPLMASLVKEFEDRMSAGIRQFVGKQVPEISLKAADGKDIPLKSYQGKPVLLDFWATWCAPCVESLPTIQKLYRETLNGGLVLLSIDEDDDAKTASEFWAKHKEAWPNFHGNIEMLGQFPEHGIPYFVLIDASGHVVFSAAGFDETGLRAALANLDPAFATLSTAPTP
jgi:thiol-disulfide isomerase/thioredoxin